MTFGSKLIALSLVISGILASILTYGFVVGATSHYSMSIHVPDDNRDVLVTSYRGTVVALQTKTASDGSIISQWRVEARQFRFGDQTVDFVYSRVPLITSEKEDSNDSYNRVFSNYTFMFFKIVRSQDDVYVFNTFPRNRLHKGKIEGYLDLWDK